VCAQVPVGSSVYLREAAAQNVGVATPDPAPGLPIGNVVMRFDVVSDAIIPDTPPIPSTLVDLPPIPQPDSFFEWRFTLDNGQFHMVQWDIVDSIAELRQKREQIAQRRRDAVLPVEDGLPKPRKERAG